MTLKLETFVPQNAGSTALAAKEDACSIAREDGYAAGFRDGADASAAEHAEMQDQLRSQFLEALTDARQDRMEARRAAEKSLLALAETLIRTLTPALAEAGFTAEVVSTLDKALSAAPAATPIIHCASETQAGLQLALSGRTDVATVKTDPMLTPLEARISWDNGHDHVDLDTACATILNALDTHLGGDDTQYEEETRNVG